ncbi:MAG: hypothetical protein PF437_04235 [Sulfurimonas sp.]|jgi:hypothetical protein|nr:hypothetical protein [Sulfurimonas sp.]
MNSIKNKILLVLLFTFTFFVMHDYIVVVDHHADFKSKAFHIENEDTSVGVQAHIHEAIHMILAFNFESKLSLQVKLLDSKPSVAPFSLISHINLVPQRPPLT